MGGTATLTEARGPGCRLSQGGEEGAVTGLAVAGPQGHPHAVVKARSRKPGTASWRPLGAHASPGRAGTRATVYPPAPAAQARAPAPVCLRPSRGHEPWHRPRGPPRSPQPPRGCRAHHPGSWPGRAHTHTHRRGPRGRSAKGAQSWPHSRSPGFTLIVAEAPRREKPRQRTGAGPGQRCREVPWALGCSGGSQSGPQASRQRQQVPEPEEQSKGKRKPRAQSRGRLGRPPRPVPARQGRGRGVCRAAGKADRPA